jgi:hypothetical protein
MKNRGLGGYRGGKNEIGTKNGNKKNVNITFCF